MCRRRRVSKCHSSSQRDDPRGITGVRLTALAYGHGWAMAPAEKGGLARPTGFARTCTHSEVRSILIEGAEEWEAGWLRSAKLGRSSGLLQRAARVNVTWVTPLGEEVASIP